VPTIWLKFFVAENSIYFMTNDYLIREYREEDFDVVTILWRVAREISLPDFQIEKGHFFYEDQAYFRTQILKKDRVWVVEIDCRPVAFMAMENEFIDQLYVDPRHQRCGIGEALLKFARSQSSEHLWLYTL